MSVIVTNAKNRIAYNVTKSLAKKGILVYTGDFVRSSMTFASRYSAGNFVYPSPFRNQDKFISNIIENIQKYRATVLMPVFEETFLISKHKAKLQEYVKMAIPDYDQILLAQNKNRWEKVAEELNIPVPKTYTLDAGSMREISYPILLKPKQGGGGWGIKEIICEDDLAKILESGIYLGRPLDRFFLQDKIQGETHCVAMLFSKGKRRAHICYKQIRDFPVFSGQATYRVSVRNIEAEKNFEKLLEKISWHGVCQADFIVDRKKNISYLIDVNPRFWGSVIQSIASGVDFPFLAYKLAMNGDIETINDFKTGVITRWLGGDVRVFYPMLKKSKNKMKFIKEFLFANNKTLLYDDFDLKDPFPFGVWVYDSVIRILRNRSLKPSPHDSLDGIWE